MAHRRMTQNDHKLNNILDIVRELKRGQALIMETLHVNQLDTETMLMMTYDDALEAMRKNTSATASLRIVVKALAEARSKPQEFDALVAAINADTEETLAAILEGDTTVVVPPPAGGSMTGIPE